MYVGENNIIGLLVYPGDAGSGMTVKIGVSIIPRYLTQNLISQLQACEIEGMDIFYDAENNQAHLSREVPTAAVEEEAEKLQSELQELGIFTELTPLPTTYDVDRVLEF